MAQRVGTGVRIEFRIHPHAKRSRLTGTLENAYKLDIAAPPTDGKANEACVDFLAKIVEIHHSHIRILRGQTSRSKIFAFDGLTEDELRRRLNQAI
jgi:uncharacterized protein (TIGR00251 family)